MTRGTVKWFNGVKGVGSIATDGGATGLARKAGPRIRPHPAVGTATR
jgi:hypothetical protein